MRTESWNTSGKSDKTLILKVSVYENHDCLGHWLITKEEAKQENVSYNPHETYDIQVTMAPQFWNSLLSYLKTSSKCREMVLSRCYSCGGRGTMSSRVILSKNVTNTPKIDYAWTKRLLKLVGERSTLDTVMSYLSTLGGAFSSLGDTFPNCAEKAGEISMKQFQVALQLGEEPLVARCRLYLALSLIQQEKFLLAKQLIIHQYFLACKLQDTKLKNMCKGIWAKLRYAKRLCKESTGTLKV